MTLIFINTCMILPCKKIALPEPSSELVQEIFAGERESPAVTPTKFLIDKHISKNTYETADCIYYTNTRITELAKKQFDIFFDPADNPQYMGLCLRNYSSEKLANYPPHADARRMISLNYILDTGGENVITTTYNKFAKYDLSGGMVDYAEVGPICNNYKLSDRVWYSLDVVQYHSVQNIETSRIMLAIKFTSIQYQNFCEKYASLLSDI